MYKRQDTGCFRYSNTSATTLRIAASLIDAGADAAEINRIMFDTKSRARLNVERLAMESITSVSYTHLAEPLQALLRKSRFQV